MKNLSALSMLSATPPRWLDLAAALPADLLWLRPAPAEWSAAECLRHQIDSERVYQYRISCFLEGVDFPVFLPDRDGANAGSRPPGVPADPAGLAGEFARLRSASLEALAALQASDLHRCVRHQEFGPVTLGQMINAWAAHDLDHTIQAERALMQPYLHASGPWIEIYRDHLVETIVRQP
jgi:hypothetical protein